jgi:hypothetical protein
MTAAVIVSIRVDATPLRAFEALHQRDRRMVAAGRVVRVDAAG